jgi:DNA-binding transcriptional MerR regulator
MTERTFAIKDICTAVSATPFRVHAWISRGYFEPVNPVQSGVARDFTLQDAIHLAAILRLGATGIPVARAVQLIGRSPLQTAGQEVLSARVGDTEIRLDMTAIAERVRTRLLA